MTYIPVLQDELEVTMKDCQRFPPIPIHCLCSVGVMLIGAAVALPVVAHAFPRDGEGKAQRAEVGKVVTAKGTIFEREKLGGKWQPLMANAVAHSGDMLLGLPGAAIDSKNG